MQIDIPIEYFCLSKKQERFIELKGTARYMKSTRHSRHAEIIDLIRSKPIKTQEELADELKKNGYSVTQATISRDIKQLGLFKTLSENGEYRYVATPSLNSDLLDKLVRILSSSLVDLDIVDNIIVAKTLSGTASAVCEAIDSLNLEGVVGTLAGNNAIFILSRNPEKADEVFQHIKKLVNK